MGGDGSFDYAGTGTGVPAAFTIATTGGTGAYAGNPIAFVPSQFGTKTVTETVPAGWMLTDIVCSGDTSGVLIGIDADFDTGDTSVSVPIDAGDSVSCTFTNTRQIALVIQKVVVNDDGGTATVGDFGITTSAGALDLRGRGRGPGRHLHLHRHDAAVAPGTYTLAELELAGYEPSDWTCTNGDGGAFDAGSVTLAAGDPVVTCSITNDDQPVSLVIQKVVVNDDGGTAIVGDFGITTSAGALVFGAAVEAPADTFTYTAATPAVAPGTYTLAELELAGYEPSDWTCTNGDGGAFDAGTVTLAAGDPMVTCSITNDDQPVEPRHREGRRQRRRRQRRSSPTSGSPPAPARSSSGPPSRPRPTPSPTPPRRSRSRPARTAWPSSRWPATRRPTGPAPTATAAPSTPAPSPSPRATRWSPARVQGGQRRACPVGQALGRMPGRWSQQAPFGVRR